MEMVRKVLAPFSIFPPSMNFLDGDSGHEVFEISQFGDKMGMTNDGTVVVKNADPYFVYFEYAMNDRGSFDIFCEIVTEDELSEIMSDIEDEMENGDTTNGDMEDAEDSFDEYKSENQIKEDKDPCWKGYEMIGMKKKGGRKVPNCVPVSEENLDEMKIDKKSIVGKVLRHRETVKKGWGTFGKAITADTDDKARKHIRNANRYYNLSTTGKASTERLDKNK
jgi:hypothetical protein